VEIDLALPAPVLPDAVRHRDRFNRQRGPVRARIIGSVEAEIQAEKLMLKFDFGRIRRLFSLVADYGSPWYPPMWIQDA